MPSPAFRNRIDFPTAPRTCNCALGAIDPSPTMAAIMRRLICIPQWPFKQTGIPRVNCSACLDGVETFS